ncbi:redox-regulated ATPase YchF [Candidatus Woesearchaeota archaeon]|nr:redox-regulated ATPase YchF [Nanoarchaeota archaeon]MCB9370448.1 redox-regulated ATPase YchF [Candidatus Woesearchaeota archaeon]USN43526.1 MAG: redox-regulated ATPase YchF [Candidatus Woesearchaeota archaeon]
MIIGIVGKPNVGKSAFFRSLTLADAESGNFPFTTIDANEAIGYVKIKDPATDFEKHSNPREGYVAGEFRFVPVQIIDVAGLVPGAHEGKGLGNKFLDDLRQADALIHIIDLSGGTNEKGEPVEINSYNPAEDILFLEAELDHWFYNIIERNWPNIDKKIRMQDMKIEHALVNVLSGLNIKERHILQALSELGIDKTTISKELFSLARKLRELSKPMIIAANKCDVLQENKLWEKKLNILKEEFPQHKIIPVMAEYEFNLRKAQEKQILRYIPGEGNFEILNENLNENQKKGLEIISKALQEMRTTGVQETLNAAVFDLLKMKPIFPGGVSKLEDSKGNVLPDCFLMEEKATALDFAYRLHTDFGKNFIKAINVRTKMMVGKDHILSFGDIVEIVSGK